VAAAADNPIAPDWDKELANARELNKKRQQSAATLWMDKTIYEEDNAAAVG
jgi:D-alanine transfer protein